MKMFRNKLLIFMLVRSTLGSDTNVDFPIDFFKERSVKMVCLLTCGDVIWNNAFVKKASKLSIAVSNVDIVDASQSSEAVSPCLRQKLTSIGIYVNTKCNNFEDALLYASENSFFDESHKWLIVNVDDGISNDTDIFDCLEANLSTLWLSIFDKLKLSVDADITVSLQKGNVNDVYEVYNFGKIRGGNVILNNLGTWNNKSAILPQLNGYKYYRRWDFNYSTINLVAVMSPPPKKFEVDMIVGNNPSPGVSIITILSLRVLEELKEIHNIRFNYTITDRWIGNFKRNSSWVAADYIYFKEQDLTPVLRVPPAIFKKVDILLVPLSSIETRYYYRIPMTGPGNFENQFFRPLTPGAWACVMAVASLCALMLFLTAKVERRPSSLQYALFSVMATFCQQFFDDAAENDTRESSARQLAVLVTGISCVLIYNYYTSSVVSWLLNGPPPSINSLEELLQSPLSLIFQDVGYTRSWLQSPTYYFNTKNADMEDKLRKYKVFNKKKGEPLLLPLEEGIKMVKAGGYAYHTDVYNANTLISRTFTQSELCELGSLESISKTSLYVVVPKGSPYKEFFNWNLLRLHEAGIISRIQRLSMDPDISCGGSSPRALALGGAAPAFLLLVFGFILATFILLIERFVKRNSFKSSQMTFLR